MDIEISIWMIDENGQRIKLLYKSTSILKGIWNWFKAWRENRKK